MTGQLIGTLILWLIVAVIVIAIIVYLVNWLYRRSSKEVSFVRTGLFGEKVVINGGAFVLPIIHDVTPVNMNVLRMAVTRANDEALITRDRMRVDIDAEFYLRVRPQREAVSIAAATLGRRTLQPDQLNTLLSGRLVSALRSIASEMTMEEMHEKRGIYVQKRARSRPPRRSTRTDSNSKALPSPISTRPTCNISTPPTASMRKVSRGSSRRSRKSGN